MQQGERQVALTRAGIRRDHVARYEWAAKHLGVAKTVIDVACGVGYGTQLLAESGRMVMGCDKDAEALNYARKNYAHGKAAYRVLDAESVSDLVRIVQHDAAVCFETVEHLRDPRPLLTALRKSCKTLLVSAPNQSKFPWNRHAFHHRHYTQAQFESLLNECGWTVTEWWGQKGDKSEVERNVKGRTLIAVAKRTDGFVQKVKPVRKAKAAPAAPDHVAILGLGPSLSDYLMIARQLGGRSAFCDEVWAINALGNVTECDRVFHMDDVRIQEIRAAARPDSNIANMLKWMKKHPGPIYTSRKHPDYPGLVAFPLQDVIRSTNFAYFNSTSAYAVAYALHIGVKKISIFGFDFTYPNAHDAEKGRACVEFWLGMAAARGIKIQIPHKSSLMDSCMGQDARLYGYDTVKVKLALRDGLWKTSFTERETLPTADEIEHRYDHSRHPSPLVDQ
jgi:SAM-dependent methyltransferase